MNGMTAPSPLAPPSTATHRLTVDVWSDIACPWCYIGKRHLEQALAQFPHAGQVDVIWHSFELDVTAPVQETRSMGEILAGKYGRSPQEAQGMMDHMTQVAAQDGLDYHFERLVPTNTFQAHQVLHLAREHGVQDALKERLMRAYLGEGEHLGEPEVLARLAAEVGLDPAEVRRALSERRYAAAVRQDEAQAMAYGIQGVPFFVLDGRYGVSGAQPAETLLGALTQAWQESQPLQLLGTAAQAGSALTDGCEDGSCAVPQK